MEGYTVITMDEITKDTPEEESGHMPVVREQRGTKVALAKPEALVVYEEKEDTSEKKGPFRKLGRKTTLSRGQLGRLLLENIEVFPEYEARLLRAILNLKALTAQEVMTPLSEMVPLTIESLPSEVLNLCRTSNHRYIPIYEKRVDWLLGIVDGMEVLTSEPDEKGLAPFVRDVYYVPALKSAMDLLDDLRQSEIPYAIVVNEHGSCIGAVELIDVLERVIGDIKANPKRTTAHIEELGKDDWRIDARVLIVDVNKTLGTQIPSDRCDTLGGFILMLLGRLPQKGEKVEYEDFEFNIDETFKYGISQIRALKKPARRTRR